MSHAAIAAAGGFFAILIAVHFFADWLFQSHTEAMAKAKDRGVRFWHCIKYALPFWPVLVYFGLSGPVLVCSMALLFFSHYVIDSYVPVMLWAKYLRRAPQFDRVRLPHVAPRSWEDRVVDAIMYKSDEEAFKAFASTPLGLILIITMDQFFHVVCLLPVAAALVLLV